MLNQLSSLSRAFRNSSKTVGHIPLNDSIDIAFQTGIMIIRILCVMLRHVESAGFTEKQACRAGLADIATVFYRFRGFLEGFRSFLRVFKTLAADYFCLSLVRH